MFYLGTKSEERTVFFFSIKDVDGQSNVQMCVPGILKKIDFREHLLVLQPHQNVV